MKENNLTFVLVDVIACKYLSANFCWLSVLLLKLKLHQSILRWNNHLYKVKLPILCIPVRLLSALYTILVILVCIPMNYIIVHSHPDKQYHRSHTAMPYTDVYNGIIVLSHPQWIMSMVKLIIHLRVLCKHWVAIFVCLSCCSCSCCRCTHCSV